MKLYATVQSERASKGQGGNKRIAVEITVGEEDEKQTILYASVEREETETENIYRLWNGDIQADKITIPKSKAKQPHWDEMDKEFPNGIIKANWKDEYRNMSTKQLEKELKELQMFLSEETSSIGRQDFIMEQAMIKELETRKANKKKDETICPDCGQNRYTGHPCK